MMSPLADAHVHFWEGMDASLRALRIERLALQSVVEQDWEPICRFSQLAQNIEQNIVTTPFLGIHPWYVAQAVPGWETRLVSLLENLRVNGVACGIGEIGLDKTKSVPMASVVFEAQLQIAVEMRLPVAIHCVKSWNQILPTLRRIVGRSHIPIIFHKFNGSKEIVRELSRCNAWFSFASTASRKSLSIAPPSRVLIESDAQNASQLEQLTQWYHEAAEILRTTPENLAAQTVLFLEQIF
ncbi:MAG: TatD family hydrolase [Planctomycetia bacterium]|nr:TatD family hydrolase [Planctomycetia bacterium]